MTLPVALTTEIQKLAPSAIIELFELDATSLGGDVLRFHAGTNNLTQNVVWQGETYVRFPIRVAGFEMTGQGQFPRPKLQVANVLSAITPILLQYNDLLGAKVTRKRTLAKFLDAVNFEGGVNPNADDTAEFQEDIYYIDRKAREDRDSIEFELAASVDLVGVALPRRQVIQNVCIWQYRGAECGFTGMPLIDQNDEQITTASSAEGQALIAAIAVRDAAAEELDAAEDVLSAAAQSMGSNCSYYLQSSDIDVTDLGTGWVTGVVHPTPTEYNAKLDGVTVSLGLQYRVGAFYRLIGTAEIFYLDTYAVGAGCAAATTAYNTALADRDAKQTALDAAQSDVDAAIAALPTDDPLYVQDVCGKRLASCKARFGENEELPYGSFPASGLIK